MNITVSREILSTSIQATGRLQRFYETVLLPRILYIRSDEVRFQRRGFSEKSGPRVNHLEHIGANFLKGFQLAARWQGSLDDLADQLNRIPSPFRGFAFEGCAMALALRDALSVDQKLWHRFVTSAGASHIYVGYVGRGWAIARLPFVNIEAVVLRGHGPFEWLLMDGYGFHQGYFHCQKYITAQRQPHFQTPEAADVFDQGLGRALWFFASGSINTTQSRLQCFSPSRRNHLWSGVGLASAYAGTGDTKPIMAELLCKAGIHRQAFLQGVAFAAKALTKGEMPVSDLDDDLKLALGTSCAELAQITDEALVESGVLEDPSRYHAWRALIMRHF